MKPWSRLAAVAAAVAIVAAGLAASAAWAGAGHAPTAVRTAAPAPVRADFSRAPVSAAGARGACIRRVAGGRRPLLVVLGASFTAGVGPGAPTRAWSVELARALGWRSLVVGASGIGYTHPAGRLGALPRLVDTIGLAHLHPSLVVVQVGHDDWRTPLAVEARRVRGFWAALRRALPASRLATITVFAPGRRPGPRLRALDRVIVHSARAADPALLVMDPAALGWRFHREHPGGLHPSAGGDRQIAGWVLAFLRAHGIRPASPPTTTPPVCDLLPPRRRWSHRRGHHLAPV